MLQTKRCVPYAFRNSVNAKFCSLRLRASLTVPSPSTSKPSSVPSHCKIAANTQCVIHARGPPTMAVTPAAVFEKITKKSLLPYARHGTDWGDLSSKSNKRGTRTVEYYDDVVCNRNHGLMQSCAACLRSSYIVRPVSHVSHIGAMQQSLAFAGKN